MAVSVSAQHARKFGSHDGTICLAHFVTEGSLPVVIFTFSDTLGRDYVYRCGLLKLSKEGLGDLQLIGLDLAVRYNVISNLQASHGKRSGQCISVLCV